ncbi:hypothetical protein RchiOBHm_Chr2g0085971 [Rosa chinensis]|uniref:Uncharacterized protein n=1 Tax=Rosa chinensis TaxID=74649 RepID=A0A2P6RI90_ROSCH|nr:hypothetical protein RchiOBHm_Chr2g0085971 [Rosa chinensis]
MNMKPIWCCGSGGRWRAAGVADDDVLGEGEVDGGVEDRKGGELDGADGDFGVFG